MATSTVAEVKVPTALNKLHDEFIASGGKPPAKKEQQDLIAAWRKAEAARKLAEAALEKTQKAVSDAAAGIIRRCTGKKNAVIDGVTYVPMCRGETVFFRRLGGEDPVELG
jgi:hypothetical protein